MCDASNAFGPIGIVHGPVVTDQPAREQAWKTSEQGQCAGDPDQRGAGTGDPLIIGKLEVSHLRGNHHSIERLSGHSGQLYLNRGRHSIALPKSRRIVEP
jgi:hypothetical protein